MDKLIITSRNLKGDDGYKIFSVRIKENILKQVESISADTGRSRNEIISMLLEFALNNCEIKTK